MALVYHSLIQNPEMLNTPIDIYNTLEMVINPNYSGICQVYKIPANGWIGGGIEDLLFYF